jgi:hypothetical protein
VPPNAEQIAESHKSLPAKDVAMPSNTSHEICVWPDGTWCEWYEVHEFTHMSDDYMRVALSPELSDEEIEQAVLTLTHQGE